MRILLAGTYDPAFARNRKLKALLQRSGHDVRICAVSLWAPDRVGIPNSGKARSIVRALKAYPLLIWRFLRSSPADVVMVCYPGWFDMLVLGPLARMRRVPIVFDIFISLHDTVVSDRQLVPQRSLLAKALRLVDRLALRTASRTLADTPVHAAFFAEMGGLDPSRLDVVWLGADDDQFGPCAEIKPMDRRVLFHGTFIKLQGLETILRSAKLLEGDDVSFRIIGTGQEQAAVDRLIADTRPSNVELVGLVPLDQVAQEIASAEVCLGIFGTSDKAARVVPNKLYECLAVGRPVITADTPAIRSAFDEHEVATCAVGDPEALADTIRQILDDDEARERLARAGFQRYQASYHSSVLVEHLDGALRRAAR